MTEAANDDRLRLKPFAFLSGKRFKLIDVNPWQSIDAILLDETFTRNSTRVLLFVRCYFTIAFVEYSFHVYPQFFFASSCFRFCYVRRDDHEFITFFLLLLIQPILLLFRILTFAHE